MSQLTESLSAAFADASLTVPVEYGAQSATRGIYELEDQSLSTNEGEDVVAEVITLDLIAGTLVGLKRFQPITVDGVAHTIQDLRRTEGGAMVRLYLATVIEDGE